MSAILAFLLTIGILVVIHEFGHYIFARIFKVKIISFSIGFGPKLLKWQGKHNEWCISSIPLGGYVKMLDEREATVANEYKHLAYNNKAPWQKILIAFAGPFFNILFAFFAYYALSLYGVYTLKPIIQDINPTPLIKNLQAIKPNSTIIAIDKIPTHSWEEANNIFSKEIDYKNIINFSLQHDNKPSNIALDLTNFKQNIPNASTLSDIGIYPIEYISTISYIEPQSVADKSGLKAQDKIISINNIDIYSWFQVSNLIKNSPGQKMLFEIERNNKPMTIEITPESLTDDGQIIGKIGIMPTLNTDLLLQNSYIQKYTWISGIGYGYNACISALVGNITMISLMLQNKVSWHNLGGPVTIAQASDNAMHKGIKDFIDLLALISLSIALMNLLPIPVLDGGHILIYTIEWIIGKPISNSIQQTMFAIGFMIIMLLTLTAFYNDFLRLLNW